MKETVPTKLVARALLDLPAALELIPHPEGESFRWAEHGYPDPVARWNYHPEVEIHLIRRSSGNYLIGDQIGAFGPGHVAIVGPGLPHDWMTDLAPGEVVPARDALIQFTVEWLERCVDAMPELSEAKALVTASSRGIIFFGATAAEAARLIELIGVTRRSERMAYLIGLLSLLARAPNHERQHVVHELYASEVEGVGKAAVDVGMAYVLANLAGQVRLSEAARRAYMSEPSFSRHFKKASGMTFSDLVKRLRLARACRLLDQTESSISAISAASGFSNLANFNRQFRAEMGMSPRAYRALGALDRPYPGLVGFQRPQADP